MSEPLPSACTNGTGVTASMLPPNEASLNANDSTETGGPQNGGSISTSASATSATSQPTGGAAVMTVAWGVLGAAVFGAAALI